MASQIERPKVYANFRPTLRERLAAKGNSSWRDDRPGMSEEHLALIRQMPCAVCLTMPAGEAHHLKQGTGERGMAIRSSDRWAVPLCPADHGEVERAGSRNETTWFAGRGITDALELAAALWRVSGDLPRMIAALMAHRA